MHATFGVRSSTVLNLLAFNNQKFMGYVTLAMPCFQ